MAQYDPQARKQGKRKQREKGVWIYVPAVELEKAGVDPNGPAPWYKVWASAGGGLRARFYTEG